ncbi:hypothetical protein BJ138DRAFT_1166194 [Hygrophoropsis aurantiaca]|uniref:Uncharacterized protein n=1 Tax=Hygrophoropsis aurantiaca TaxID=72124 RepID=A0ACB7ZU97_9AGAM|nr:hypothetical protein BJ138DRAFT_1166194 [Hygrophoropsis aurantiaca]
MPPKASGAKKTKKTAGDAQSFVLNESALEPLPSNVMSKGEDDHQLQLEIDSAFLGFAKYHLIDGPSKIQFQMWNDRDLNDIAGKKIMASINVEGMLGFQRENMMIVVVKKGDIEADALTSDDTLGSQLPELRLKHDHVLLMGASGQHRFWAVNELIKDWTKEANTWATQISKIASKSNPKESDVEQYNDLRYKLAARRGDINEFGWWGFRIYDADVLLKNGDRAARKLSQNKILFEYGETDEEKLVAYVRAILDAKKISETRYLDVLKDTQVKAKKQNSKISRVMNCEYVVQMLMSLLGMGMGSTFRNMSTMKINWMAALVDTHAAFMNRFVLREMKLFELLASPDPFPGYSSVKPLLQLVEAGENDDAKVKEARQKLLEYRQNILTSKPGDANVFKNAIGEIDNVFVGHIRTPQYLGIKTNETMEEMQSYTCGVVTTLQRYWTKNLVRDSDFQRETYDKIVARVAVWLCYHIDLKHFPNPLLTPQCIDAAHVAMGCFKQSIHEVCRWVEPMVDYFHTGGSRTQDFSDYTTCMFDNLRRRAYIKDPENLFSDIFDYFWNSRTPQIFHLEYLVTDDTIVGTRITDKSVLGKMFAEPDKAKSTGKQRADFAKLKSLVAFMTDVAKVRSTVTDAPASILGAAAMLTTYWDYRGRGSNKVRDWNPAASYIIAELEHVAEYRPKLMKGPIVSLRLGLYDVITKYDKGQKRLHPRGHLETVPNFSWWDGIIIPDQIVPILNRDGNEITVPEIIAEIKLRKELNVERDQLLKVIRLVEGMDEAQILVTNTKGVAVKHTASSVAHPLRCLIKSMSRNSAFKRWLEEHEDDDEVYDSAEFIDPHDLEYRGEMQPERYIDHEQGDTTPQETTPAPQRPPKPKPRPITKGKSPAVRISDDDEQDVEDEIPKSSKPSDAVRDSTPRQDVEDEIPKSPKPSDAASVRDTTPRQDVEDEIPKSPKPSDAASMRDATPRQDVEGEISKSPKPTDAVRDAPSSVETHMGATQPEDHREPSHPPAERRAEATIESSQTLPLEPDAPGAVTDHGPQPMDEDSPEHSPQTTEESRPHNAQTWSPPVGLLHPSIADSDADFPNSAGLDTVNAVSSSSLVTTGLKRGRSELSTGHSPDKPESKRRYHLRNSGKNQSPVDDDFERLKNFN